MSRYIQRGVTVIKFAITQAGATPTLAEINGALNVTPEIADVSGWTVEGTEADTPDLASTWDSKIPGVDTAADSTFTLYDNVETSDAVRDGLVKGQNGWVYIMRKGQAAGKPMHIFPVRVRHVSDTYSVGNDAARYSAGFSITKPPTLNHAIPSV